MVDIIGRAKVVITGDVDSSSIDSAGGKIGAGLKKAALIGVAALGTIGAAAITSVKAFEEAEKQSAKLANVLGNMGKSGAVDSVEKLADSLQRVTGVDDEVIKGGQSILATFSQVAESAGTVGGTFERATKAALDMSATGFGSVESASVMLGKALQDPVKGVSALGRAGVTFSEDQKKMIESLVETGDVAAAQNIILKEVEKQVGGTAEATATESAKIAAAVDEIQSTLGGIVVDIFTPEDTENTQSFSDALFNVNEELTKFQESESFPVIEAAVAGIGNAFQLAGEGIGLYIESMTAAGEGFRTFQQELDDGWEAAKIGLQEDIDSIVQFVREAPGKIADQVGEWIDAGQQLIGGLIEGLKSAASDFDFKSIINAALGLPKSVSLGDGPGGLIPDKTFTIKAFAAGGPASGLALVGERGPELVNLPNGSYVHSNANSEAMLEGAGGGNVFNITTTGSPDDIVRELDWWAKYGAVTTYA